MSDKPSLTREQIILTLSLGEPLDQIVGPNVDKMVDFFLNKGNVKGLHFDWQEGAKALTPDQRAAEVLKWQTQITEYASLPVEQRMYDTILTAYKELRKVNKLTRFDVKRLIDSDESYTVDDLQKVLSEIFGIVEGIQLFSLGNWITREDQQAIWDEEKAEQELINSSK